jgi:hypothetical protein
VKNFEYSVFKRGFMIFTLERVIILENSDLPEYIEAPISHLSFIMLNLDTTSPKEVLVKFDENEQYQLYLEIIIKSEDKISKITKKLAKYYEYQTGNKIKVYNSLTECFLSDKTMEYINLCYYDEIKSYRSLSKQIRSYKLSDFKKVDLLGEGSNGKVRIEKNILFFSGLSDA